MKRSIAILAATILMWASSPLGAAETSNVVGHWNGTLDVGSVKLRLVFKIDEDAGGGLTGQLDSIDQGAHNIPVDSVTVKGNALRLEVNAVKGVYEGTLDVAGTKATGEWTQGAQSFPLTLEKGEGTNSGGHPT